MQAAVRVDLHHLPASWWAKQWPFAHPTDCGAIHCALVFTMKRRKCSAYTVKAITVIAFQACLSE
jgi:hypothetical protein